MQIPQYMFFRPSLIIFLGDEGMEIRDQFGPERGKPLAYLDPRLRQSIGLIQFPSQTYDNSAASNNLIPAQYWLARDLFADTALIHDNRLGEGSFRPNLEAPIEQLLRFAVKDVQLEMRIQDIDAHGYKVVKSDLQIYIVGDVESEWTGYILQAIHQELERVGLNTEVCYVLSRYDPDILMTGPAWTHRSDWERRALTNFSFIYEDAMRPYTGRLTHEQSYYAAAESLFALIATGITTDDRYKTAMQLQLNQDTYERIGNMSSSIVVFPYTAARRFCSAHLGAELVDAWLDRIRLSKVPYAERQAQQERARSDVGKLESWIKDSEVRPGTESFDSQGKDQHAPAERVLRWPTLAILRRGENQPSARQPVAVESVRSEDPRQDERRKQEERHSHEDLANTRRLHESTRTLFASLTYKDVEKEMRHHRENPERWADIAFRRSGTATDMFITWGDRATAAWMAAAARIRSGMQRTVYDLWSSRENGHELTRAYMDEYDERLSELANLLSAWRRKHREDYETALDEFERQADGDWVTTEDQSNILNGGNAAGGQATPRGATIGPQAAAAQRAAGMLANQGHGGAPGIQGAGQPQNIGLHQHLPPREMSMTRRLRQRLTWEHARVPRWPNLGAAALLTAPALLFSILALTPTINPLAVLVCVGVIGGLMAVGGWLFHGWKKRDLVKTRKTLLQFYACYYAYRCEQREDQLRVSVMSPLRQSVQRMRERLDGIDDFLVEVGNRLEEAYRDTHDALFTERNPGAVRDVYVGNGAVLEKVEWPLLPAGATPAEVRRIRVERRAGRTAAVQDRDVRRARGNERLTTNTLEDFAERIRGKRLSERERKKSWHRTNDLLDTLLRSSQNERQSMLEMSLEETMRYIWDFSEEVIDEYLQDRDLVDIGLALDREETWNRILDRMTRPAYRMNGGNPAPELVWICGHSRNIDQNRQKMIGKKQQAAKLLHTYNPDWLLVAGLFRDRSPAQLNIDLLFPYS